MGYAEKRITKDGKIRYRMHVNLKGHPHATATFGKMSEGKIWVERVQAEMRSNKYFKKPEAEKRYLYQLIDRYIDEIMPTKPKSAPNQVQQLKEIRQEIGHLRVSDVTPAILCKLRDDLLKVYTPRGGTRSNATVVRYLSILSHVFIIANKEWQWMDESPMDRVKRPKEPRGRVKYLNAKERAIMLDECKKHEIKCIYPVVIVALATGMRKNEILRLRWEDVDLDRGKIIIQESKNGYKRSLALTGKAKEVMIEWHSGITVFSELVFPSLRDPQNKPQKVCEKFRGIVRRLGMKDFRFHDLRHCAASELAMTGATLLEISHILGHRNHTTALRYAHFADNHSDSVIDRMNKRMFA